MLKRSSVVLILFSLLFISCENSTDVSMAIQYQEYIVINAQLNAGKAFEGVTITHTLPLGVQYDIQKAEIKNAVAYIQENGVKIIPVHYTSNGLYEPLSPLAIFAGSRYELFADINGKLIYSETYIPDTPRVVQASNAGNNYLIAEVSANPGEAYGAAWIISRNGFFAKANDFHSIMTADHFPSNITLRTMDIPAQYNNSFYSDSFYVQVYAFDKAYKDYFISKGNSHPIDNTFTSGGGAVAWNVYGDKVIGLFIGVAEGKIIHP
ncbi:MAG TPA: hypothetical protein VLB50_05045 [Ignavibacteriaceae bacterium]|nr:hypothetical protein [Ignavibacteriaceae bacterium]